MSLANFTSGINKIEESKPLSEWAVEYIRAHSLSRKDFSEMGSFRSLSRRQKDAIRYQIRKENRFQNLKAKAVAQAARNISASPKPQLLQIAKIALGIWISAFLLFDIVAIYAAKGASPLMAWQAAILVEVCIIVAAMSERRELRRVAYVLFFYNVLLFGFMEFDNAILKTSNVQSSRVQIVEKTSQIVALKRQLREQQDASSKSLRQLSTAHERGFITSGTRAFETLSRTLNNNTSTLSNKISDLEIDIRNLSSTTHTSLSIWVISILYFLMRSLLQFFSVRLLRGRNGQIK